MRFIARWGIILVAVLFSDRIIPGIQVGNYWYEIVFALIVGWFNAILRPTLLIFGLHLSWLVIGFSGIILNIFMMPCKKDCGHL